MASHEIDARSSAVGRGVPRAVAVVSGLGFVALGAWAMLAPRAGL